MRKEALWTKGFINICVSNFFLFLTFYYLLVSMPVYAIEKLHGQQSNAGLIVTVFLISAIAVRPVAGNVLQKFGKKSILILSLIIYFVVSLFYFFPHSIKGLLIVRAIHGIGFGMATTAAGTIVADLIPNSRRGEGMGYFSMSMNIAMVIGPFFGLMAVHSWNINSMFLLASFCAFLSFIIGFFIHVPHIENKSTSYVNKKVSFHLSNILEPAAVKISIVAGLFGMVYSTILSFISVFAKEEGLSSVSGYFFVMYAVIMLLARPFAGKWFDQYGANMIIYPCIIIFSIGMFVLSNMHTATVFFIAAGLIGLGYGSLFPSFQTIAVQSAEPERRGLATATFLSLFDTGIGIGSFLAGVIGEIVGFRHLYLYSSIYILICLAVYYLLLRKKEKSLFSKGLKSPSN
ncbi:MFS transporter [Niallia sp. 01092]|uniref:MFS transporter n=1 Tax=unclassified Niallia TaxID=2837522 RepID=UPI003FD4E045